MIECFLSWCMFFEAISTEENKVFWYIACGIFAIASNITTLNKEKE